MTLLRSLRRLTVFALFFATALLPAQDEAKSSGSIHYNYSRRIRYYSWATVDYKVTNPTNKPIDVKIQFSPLNQRNMTVYENKFTVGAGMRYQFHMPVTIGTVDKYAVDMFLDGHRVTNVNSRETVIRLAQPENRYIVFVNDYEDMTFGMFSKNEGLNGSYVNTLNRTLKAATHFAGYDNAHVVVLMRPDFNRMNSRQYNAILDHVARGGTLIFGDPIGTMDAWQTPLRKCMPVTPLRIRQLERLTALTEIGGKDVFWPEGRPFLESVPRGEGVTTLKHDDFPLMRWGRYGLGKVGVCALNPSLPDLQKENRHNFNIFWRHLLSFGGRIDYASSTREPGLTVAVDKLTGITIPKAGLIRVLIICYVVIIIACVVSGFVLKQHVKSWIALGGLAVVCTWGVFMYARFRQRDLKERTATILEFTNYGSEDQSTEQLVSLTLKRDQTLDIKNGNVDMLLRSFPPPVKEKKRRRNRRATTPQPAAGGKPEGDKPAAPTRGKGSRRNDMFGESKKGEDEELRDPLKIHQKGGRGSLDRLLLQDGKPMFFGSLMTVTGNDADSFPVVKWMPDGPHIEKWPVPEGMDPQHGILVCETGAFPVDVGGKNIKMSGSSTTAMKKISPEYVSLTEFLTRAKAPSPLLVLFSGITADSTGFLNAPDGDEKKAFSVKGRRVHMIPVLEDLDTETVTVPFERIRIEPTDAASRTLKSKGRYMDVTPVKNAFNPYKHNCFLPPAHNRMKVDEIVVDFKHENRGQNIEFKFGVRGKGMKKGKDIPLEPRSDGVYAVTLTEEHRKQLFDKSDGQFELVLYCKPNKVVKDQLARIRLNTWKVRRLRVSARGTIPPEHRGRL